MSDNIIDTLRTNMNQNMLDFLKALPLIILFSGLAAYAIYKLSIIYIKYYSIQKKTRQFKEEQRKVGINQMLLADGDNEQYGKNDENTQNTLDDEYMRITKSIQDSFKSYQDYNQKIKQYYQDNRKTDAPDVIDASVLNPLNDNY